MDQKFYAVWRRPLERTDGAGEMSSTILSCIACYALVEKSSREDIFADEDEERRLVAGQRGRA